MLEVLIHGFFWGGTSGFWGGQVVLVIHMSVAQVDFLTKFEPCNCQVKSTAVGGACNSPIANTTILKNGLFHYTGYIYITRLGSFTSPGIDTR